MKMFSLDGRRALITGSARGLGLRIAEAVAEAGAKVIINDLDSIRATAAISALREKGYQAEVSLFNVTDRDAVRRSVKELEQNSGGIDILINNGSSGFLVARG